jgi:hypothetical protein
MKSIHSNKGLVLGGLLLVTLAAGCASGPQSSNNYNRGGYSGGGFGNAYPNLEGSAGSFPYNRVYARSSSYKNGYFGDYPYNNAGDSHAYASVNRRNGASSDGKNYGSGAEKVAGHKEGNAERRADLGYDRGATFVYEFTPVYR